MESTVVKHNDDDHVLDELNMLIGDIEKNSTADRSDTLRRGVIGKTYLEEKETTDESSTLSSSPTNKANQIEMNTFNTVKESKVELSKASEFELALTSTTPSSLSPVTTPGNSVTSDMLLKSTPSYDAQRDHTYNTNTIRPSPQQPQPQYQPASTPQGPPPSQQLQYHPSTPQSPPPSQYSPPPGSYQGHYYNMNGATPTGNTTSTTVVKVTDKDEAAKQRRKARRRTEDRVGAIIISIVGCCIPWLWIGGMVYTRSRDVTAKVFGIISVVLFCLEMGGAIAIGLYFLIMWIQGLSAFGIQFGNSTN